MAPVSAKGGMPRNSIRMMPMSIAHRRDHQGPSSTAQTILMRCAIGHIPSMRRMGEITTPMATNIAKNTCLSKCSRLNPLFCMVIPHKQPKISFRHIRRKIRTGTTISCGPAAACELKTGQQQAGAWRARSFPYWQASGIAARKSGTVSGENVHISCAFCAGCTIYSFYSTCAVGNQFCPLIPKHGLPRCSI